ncbi:MAG: hypothetical protein JST82_16235 [Bacteroidetes bacterium]|nr:hypothetical protein [Bacteroidota bacterium]
MVWNRIKLPKGLNHSLWSVFDAALYPVAYMAVVPLLMRNMGMEVFGLWVLLTTIITVLQLFNFNLGVTAIKNVSFELAKNDAKRVNDAINGILHITAVLLIVVALAGFGLSHFAVKFNWWNVATSSVVHVAQCIVVAAAIAGLRFVDQVFQNIIKATERFKTAAILNMIFRFGLLGITLLLAIKKMPLLSILLANATYTLLYLGLQFVVIKKIVPGYALGRVRDKQEFKLLLNFSVWPWLQSVIVILTFQTDRFWVSQFSGLSTVSGYGLVSTMFNHIHIIFTAIAIWVLPRISSMTSKGLNPAALYKSVKGALSAIVIFSLVFFFYVSPVLFHYWVGDETYSHIASYIRDFIGFELVFAYTIMPVFYLNASGKEISATLVTLIYCALCYACMLSGLFLFHTPSAMIEGMMVGLCIAAPFVSVIVQRKLYQSVSIENTLLEMAPIYAGIALIYVQNIWLSILLAILVARMLWRFYLSAIINKERWKQLTNT